MTLYFSLLHLKFENLFLILDYLVLKTSIRFSPLLKNQVKVVNSACIAKTHFVLLDSVRVGLG